MSDEQFRVLHALKVRGLADEPSLCEITGYDEAAVQQAIAALLEVESIRARKGRVGGYALTADGRERHAALHAEATDDALTARAEEAYGKFLPLNGVFKQLCTDWQLSEDERDQVVEKLGEIHDELAPNLNRLGQDIPRFDRYGARLDANLERIRAGEAERFLKPMTGSYHDVWMELHADLLLAAGRERGADDE